MAALYDREHGALLDQLIPLQETTRRQRPCDPWFDAKFRTAKRQTRQRERADASAYGASIARSCVTRHRPSPLMLPRLESLLLSQPGMSSGVLIDNCASTALWVDKVEFERSHPSKLWESVNKLSCWTLKDS